MNHEHVFLKLKIRRFMLKQRGYGSWRGQLFANFRNTRTVSRELFDAVIAECIGEGLITVVSGEKGGEVLTWHEEAIIPLGVARG
jgi:hypothetical protein